MMKLISEVNVWFFCALHLATLCVVVTLIILVITTVFSVHFRKRQTTTAPIATATAAAAGASGTLGSRVYPIFPSRPNVNTNINNSRMGDVPTWPQPPNSQNLYMNNSIYPDVNSGLRQIRQKKNYYHISSADIAHIADGHQHLPAAPFDYRRAPIYNGDIPYTRIYDTVDEFSRTGAVSIPQTLIIQPESLYTISQDSEMQVDMFRIDACHETLEDLDFEEEYEKGLQEQRREKEKEKEDNDFEEEYEKGLQEELREAAGHGRLGPIPAECETGDIVMIPVEWLEDQYESIKGYHMGGRSWGAYAGQPFQCQSTPTNIFDGGYPTMERRVVGPEEDPMDEDIPKGDPMDEDPPEGGPIDYPSNPYYQARPLLSSRSPWIPYHKIARCKWTCFELMHIMRRRRISTLKSTKRACKNSEERKRKRKRIMTLKRNMRKACKNSEERQRDMVDWARYRQNVRRGIS